MKKFFRGLAFCLVCLFLLNTSAFAMEQSSQRASKYIMGTNATITTGSGGSLTISFSISSPGIMTKIGATTVYLYEDNGNSTKLVAPYRSSDKDYAYFMTENSGYHGANVTYTGTVGYKYYAKIYLTAGDSTGSDTVIHTTSTVTAKKS